MSDSFTPAYVGGICKTCHTGELYQYQEDPRDQLRCGRCGELDAQPEKTEPVQKTVTSTRRKAA